MKKEKANDLHHLSPESPVTRNIQGKDNRGLRRAWRASWITHPTASTLDYGVFLFRRFLDLAGRPDRFVVFVSADNRYRLFVNGRQVCSGPAVGDLDHYRYETLDIAPWLREGRNVIAAEVVNFGEFRRAAQQTYQTAFILQNATEEDTLVIDTGRPGWKVIRNEAYAAIPFLPADLKAYYCAGPGDRLDGSRYPWGWEQPEYDDSHWLFPRPATVEFAAGRGFLYGSTWFLVPREIPFPEEKPQRFAKIVRSAGVRTDPDFIRGNTPVIIPSHTTASLLFDNGVHTVAFPELTVSGGRESHIKITYAEALFRKHNRLELKEDGHQLQVDIKGNRDVTEDKEIFGVYDIFLPDGGDNRLFRPLWKRTFRYVQLDISTGGEPLILRDFSSFFTGYPFQEKARFVSDDNVLSHIWEVAWRTLRNGADEIFQDSPYYEQLQYIGDTRLSALVSVYVSGDDRLMRKAIKQFADSRIPEGLTQSRYPSYIKQIIPPFSLFWVDMIHDFYLYRDDPSFVQQFLPGIRDVLEWFADHVDSTWMLTGMEWWGFTDWVDVFPNGIPPGVDDGYSANITLQYAYALKNAVELFRYYKWGYEAEKYEKLWIKITGAVRVHCYDRVKGLFAETPEKKIFSQHTNIMAVLSETVPEKEWKELLQRLLEDDAVVEATLYFKFYLFRALQKAGLGDRYLELLGPWKKMLNDGLTTFAEKDQNPRSDCHPWSSTPCFDLLHTVAGIYPGAPGFKKIIVAPNPGYLKKIEAQMPHPSGGMIEVVLRKTEKGRLQGYVILPEGYSGYFLWNNKQYPLKSGRQDIDC